MRVISERPCKNGGWLHPLDGSSIPNKDVQQWHPIAPETSPDFNAMIDRWTKRTDENALRCLAEELCVSLESLHSLDCLHAWEQGAWAFPMRDGDGEIVGIRLRNCDGKKWAIRGSKQGLFVTKYPSSSMAFITEGPTDCAAAITLGFWSVGRPSCCCGSEHIKTLFRNRGVRRAVILSDNDAPGIQGAERLASEIGMPCATMILPAKDVREFLKSGGTRQMIDALLQQTLWRNP